MRIKEPTVMIDEEKCRRNIDRIAIKAKKNGLIFRPHFKTHQSAEIGNWFRDYGVNAITVSSVKMAKYFADNGWKDITIAFPINILEIDDINELAGNIKLNILIVDSEPLSILLDKVSNELGVFLKVDVGTHRTGILPENDTEIKKVIDTIKNSKYLRLKGFLAHYGHTYQCKNRNEIEDIFNKSNKILIDLKKSFFNEGIISIGDTPSCSLMNDFAEIDEIRPGNFIFYDIMQLNIGSCFEEDIAIVLVSPIVAKHKERNEIVVYGGAVHLSKDTIIDKNNNKVFGYVVEMNDNGWGRIIENTFVKSVSQEHGIIKVNSDDSLLFKKHSGDLIGIMPVHSCLTADLNGKYITTKDKIIFMMDKRK